MKALLPLGLLFGSPTAMIVVLVIGGRRKWSLTLIGAFEFLVISVSSLALIAAGRTAPLTVLTAVGSGTGAIVLLLRERISGNPARPQEQAAATPSGPDPAFADVSDDELLAYTERLSQMVAKQVAGFRFFPLLTLLVLAWIFLGNRLGAPVFVPLLLVLAVFAGALFPTSGLWRRDLQRSEAVLELDRRGLPRPRGTERITPAAVAMYKRGGLPAATFSAVFLALLLLITGRMSELLPDSELLWTATFVLLAALIAALVWVLAVVVRAARGEAGESGPTA